MTASHATRDLRDEVSATATAQACARRFIESLAEGQANQAPFPHLLVSEALPQRTLAALSALDVPAAELDGVSGARELHNASRRYLDPQRIARSEVCAAVAQAFQAPQTVAAIRARLGVDLTGCYLRIEYAQDVDGFWLAPHTDLGVKRFTLLCYLGPDGRPDLGTDLYAADRSWAARPAFAPGKGVVFVPDDRTWHGFEPRPIGCVRKSLIVNYVTDEWRARDQLAYPESPVRA